MPVVGVLKVLTVTFWFTVCAPQKPSTIDLICFQNSNKKRLKLDTTNNMNYHHALLARIHLHVNVKLLLRERKSSNISYECKTECLTIPFHYRTVITKVT